MKKIILIGLVGLLIGATTPVSAIEEGTSQVGIRFVQPENKTIPLKKIEASTDNEDQKKMFNQFLICQRPVKKIVG
ncbi:hypothetical protein [Enterococcus mundtii]|uniref:hypothetical protein n=1 Tax=Enterococcus mundtii TaxID=53346 RepID=UPI0002EE90B3|nr:hypothetical protein [Enterococcus mundtii]